MTGFIPYGRQTITDEDIAAVTAVLKSDFLTQGPAIPLFEDVVAKRVDAQFAIAVNSATSALHIACAALGVGPNDRIWTSPITFVASANCGRYLGADVDFVDIDANTFNMCPKALEAKLAKAKSEDNLPKVIIPVHLAGEPCDMQTIGELAKKYGVRVIEDASHAIGGSYKNMPIGSCEHSDITVFSFHPVKIVTTAEGGVATTNDPELAQRMELFRSHGITRDKELMLHGSDGPWYYEQIDLGWNYRMTDIQAALGASQITRLDSFIEKRHALADRYDDALADFPIKLPVRAPENRSGLHLYIIRVSKSQNTAPHGVVFRRLRDAKIGVNLHYIPVHLQPYYTQLGFHRGMFPEAEAYYDEAISLPMFPDLSEANQDYVIDTLFQALKV